MTAVPPNGQTRTITTPDGRTLACCEVGDPKGPLVLHNHGGPSSRLEARLFADAASKHGLRFLCVDRPGIGRSSPEETPTFAGWANDLVTIADALRSHEFGVTGWSGGGPYAVAAAAYIDPARLRHVTAIAPACYGAFGENWAADRLSKADALGGYLAIHFKTGFRLMYAAIEVAADHFRKSYLRDIAKAVNGYDRRILLDPKFADAFGDASAECFAQGANGLVQDAELAYRGWAFDVTKIERPMHLWQGTDDKLVAPFINLTVAERMPGAVWHPVEGAGHFVAIGAVDEIFAIAVRELRA